MAGSWLCTSSVYTGSPWGLGKQAAWLLPKEGGHWPNPRAPARPLLPGKGQLGGRGRGGGGLVPALQLEVLHLLGTFPQDDG